MVKKSYRTELTEADWQRVDRAQRLARMATLPAFIRQAILNETKRIEQENAHHFGSLIERQRLTVMRFLQAGCASVEDIRLNCTDYLTCELEATLTEFEGAELVRRTDAKRGRTVQWFITARGEKWLKANGAAL